MIKALECQLTMQPPKLSSKHRTLPFLIWVALRDLILSYHNGYREYRVYRVGYIGFIGCSVTIMGICSK